MKNRLNTIFTFMVALTPCSMMAQLPTAPQSAKPKVGMKLPFGASWVPVEESACKALFVDTIVPMRTKLLEIAFNVPEQDKKYAKLQMIKSFAIENDNENKRVIAVYAARTLEQANDGSGYYVDRFNKNAVAHYLTKLDSALANINKPLPPLFIIGTDGVKQANWTPTIFKEFDARRGYKLRDKLPEILSGDPQTISDYRKTMSELLLENFSIPTQEWTHKHGAKVVQRKWETYANIIDSYANSDEPFITNDRLTDFGIKGLQKTSDMISHVADNLSLLKYPSSAAHITGRNVIGSKPYGGADAKAFNQIKPDVDLKLCAGINEFSFNAKDFLPKDYIARAQAYMQWGKADNDYLIYLPVSDLWKNDTQNTLMQYEAEDLDKNTGMFIRTVRDIDEAGFDCDYISDNILEGCKVTANGHIVTASGQEYKGLIIANGTSSYPKPEGANIIMGANESEMAKYAHSEEMKTKYDLKLIRRSNPYGYHYFIANLTPRDVNGDTHLAVLPDEFTRATKAPNLFWYNPMDSTYESAKMKGNLLHVSLKSGESRILVIDMNNELKNVAKLPLENQKVYQMIDLSAGKWTVNGKAYETTFKLNKDQAALPWRIDLGDVNGTAKVYINGFLIGNAWSVPYLLSCGDKLLKGKNTLRIETASKWQATSKGLSSNVKLVK